MNWRGSPRLSAFALLSLSIHVGAFVALGVEAARRSAAAEAFDPSSQTLAGETLDIEPALRPAPDDEPNAPSARVLAASHPPAARARATAALGPPAGAPSAASTQAFEPPPLFGAVGVRFATDLATTFTRAFPQAASADRLWSSVPFGSAGRADVTLLLDDEGHLASHEIGGSPSPALREGLERTLLLLAPRAFTARASMTRLRIAARVSRDDVHDGLHGDVFALSAGSFAGDVGSAFFALPAGAGAGRRVDIDVRLLP